MTDERVPYERFPFWVKVTMLGGIQTRSRLWVYCVVTAVVALSLLVVGYRQPRPQLLYVGVIGLLLAALYPAAIWWIDRNGLWSAKK